MKLSTTDPTTTTRWQTEKRSLSKRDTALVTAHWANLTRYLAPPIAAWEWSESDLSEGLKHKLKARGLITESSRVQGCWETSDALWMHVIERAGDDEVGAEATGQLPLDLHVDIPREKPGGVRVEASRNHTNRSVQAALTGGTVPVEDLQNDPHPSVKTGRWRDPTKPDAREEAARHPAQSKLETWDVGREWIVNFASNAGIRVAD